MYSLLEFLVAGVVRECLLAVHLTLNSDAWKLCSVMRIEKSLISAAMHIALDCSKFEHVEISDI